MPLLLALLGVLIPELVKDGLAAIGKGAPAQAESPVPDAIKAIVKPAVQAALAAIEPHFPNWVKPALDQCEAAIEDALEQEIVKLNL